MKIELSFYQINLMLAVSNLFDHSDNIEFVVLLFGTLFDDFMVLIIGLVPKLSTNGSKGLNPKADARAQSPSDLLNLIVVCLLLFRGIILDLFEQLRRLSSLPHFVEHRDSGYGGVECRVTSYDPATHLEKEPGHTT